MRETGYWERLAKQRLSRRDSLKVGAAGLGTAALALTGCGGEEEKATDKGTPAAKATPQYGGDYVIGLPADPGGLDVQESVTGYWCSGNLNGYLHSINVKDQSIILQMAENVEHVDDVTYVWKLRPGIKFHDVEPTWGREVAADDVVYSMTRRRDDPTGMNDKQLLRDFTASFEATDKYAFRLVTTRPYSPALDEIGNPSYAIIPHEAVEKWGDLSQHAVGCGAFILEDYVKAERLRMRKNPEFYMAGRPFLDSIEYVFISDNSTLLQAFRTGRFDGFGGSLDKLTVQDLEKEEHIVVRKSPNYWLRTILLRVDRPPFTDKRVWEAIDLTVDRQDLIDKMAFGEGRFNGPVSPFLEYWALPQDEVREFYKVDLTKAKQLLAAAGYPDGFEVDAPVMSVFSLTKDAEIVREHLAKIGVKLNIQPKDIGVLLAQHLYQGDFQILWFQNLPYVEPDRSIGNWFSKGIAGISFTGYYNAEMDDWVWKERSEFDPEKRRQIVHDAQRAMMREHGPQINNYTPQSWATSWDWVHTLAEEGGVGLISRIFLGIDTWMTARQ
jgi:peptide/nickel transport system substrate-binding protein